MESKETASGKPNPNTSINKNNDKSENTNQKKQGGRRYYNRGRRPYKKNWRKSDNPHFRTTFKKISIHFNFFQ